MYGSDCVQSITICCDSEPTKKYTDNNTFLLIASYMTGSFDLQDISNLLSIMLGTKENVSSVTL